MTERAPLSAGSVGQRILLQAFLLGWMIPLSTPSLAQVNPATGQVSLVENCPVDVGDSPTSALVGQVRVSSTSVPIPLAKVTVRWRRQEDDGVSTPATAQVTTDIEGRYVVCGLPRDGTLEVQASFLAYRGDLYEVTRIDRPAVTLDLPLKVPATLLNLADEAAQPLVAPETGQGVTGRIMNPTTGDPISNAAVVVAESSGAIVQSLETGGDGVFRIQIPQPGTFSIDVSALSYSGVRGQTFEVVRGEFTTLNVELPPEPLGLEPLLVVSGSRPFRLEMEGFYDRFEQKMGYFLTPEELEERGPVTMEEIFRPVPGIRISSEYTGMRIVFPAPGLPGGRRVSSDGFCEPRLFVDGLPVPTPHVGPSGERVVGVDPSQVLQVTDILALEVHRRAATLPLKYGGTEGFCGAILVWTKGG